MKRLPADAARARARAMPKAQTEGAAGVGADTYSTLREYEFARRVQREIAVRAGADPVTDQERRWAAEGPCDPLDLETVRHG